MLLHEKRLDSHPAGEQEKNQHYPGEWRGWRVRGLDSTPEATRPPGDAGEDDASAPCPFCGCRNNIEDTIAASPRIHTIHQCLRCGRWFDDVGPACPRCGSPGELLGDVDAPDHGLYAQYRCCECGHGFMVRMNGDDDAHPT